MDNKMIFAALKGLGEGVLEGMKIRKEQAIEEAKLGLETQKVAIEKEKVASQSKYYSEVLPLIKQAEVGVKQQQAKTATLNVTADEAAAYAGIKQQYSKGLIDIETEMANVEKRIANTKANGGDVSPLLAQKRNLAKARNTVKLQMDDIDVKMFGRNPKRSSGLYQALTLDLESLDPMDTEGERDIVNQASQLDPAEAVKFRQLFNKRKGLK